MLLATKQPDLYTSLAARVFSCGADSVTREQRNLVKKTTLLVGFSAATRPSEDLISRLRQEAESLRK